MILTEGLTKKTSKNNNSKMKRKQLYGNSEEKLPEKLTWHCKVTLKC